MLVPIHDTLAPCLLLFLKPIMLDSKIFTRFKTIFELISTHDRQVDVTEIWWLYLRQVDTFSLVSVTLLAIACVNLLHFIVLQLPLAQAPLFDL